jgi:hypothetical protein
VLASRPPPEVFGRYWVDQVLHGYRALRGIDARCYAEVRFEDLVARPSEVLGEIASFFELPEGGGWIARAAALVRGVPALRVPELDRAQREELVAACRPGQVLLGRA